MKQIVNFRRISSTYKFVFVLLVVSLLYNFQSIISINPYSSHQWRQCDGMSITLNYFKEGMKFFEPKMHFQYSKDGKGVGEFPIIYYINAAIWHITGQNNITARLLNIIIGMFGFIALFKTARLLLKETFYSTIIPLFIFTSTLYAYYLSSFLVNVDAISFIFISWYFIAKYWKNHKIKYLIFFSLSVTIAGLLRSTVLLGIAPFFLIYFLELIGWLKGNVFKRKVISAVLLLAPIFILALWLKFAMNYNETNESVYFLTKLRPIWDGDPAELSRIFKAFYSTLLPRLYHVWVEIVLALILMLGLVSIGKQNKYLVIIWVVIFLEIVTYLLLWFLNLDVHDYYLLEIVILLPPLFLSVIMALKQRKYSLYTSKIFKAVVLFFLLSSMAYTSISMRAHYEITERGALEFFMSKDDVKYWDWYHWQYDNKMRAYETITPYLRQIGLSRDDVVISIVEYSPNISLYFMDQKGFTSIYQSRRSIKEQIEYFKEKGAKYLIVNKAEIMEDDNLAEYRVGKIGEYKNIVIYKL